MTTFKKSDYGKNRMGLVPPRALEAVARVLTYGAVKYEDNNWVRAPKWSRYIDALQRHMAAWQAGEDVDPETGESHLAHAVCCALFLMDMQRLGVGEDDRVTDARLRAMVQSLVVTEPAPVPAARAVHVAGEACADFQIGSDTVTSHWPDVTCGECQRRNRQTIHYEAPSKTGRSLPIQCGTPRIPGTLSTEEWSAVSCEDCLAGRAP